jgi:preprotein translocase subunit SecB
MIASRPRTPGDGNPARMTDLPPPPADPMGGADPNAAGAPGVRVLAQYIRDLSFENPLAPDSLRANAAQPQIELGVELNAKGRPDGYFDVELKLTARAMRDNDAVFHVELVYGGLFQVVGVPEQDLEPVLMIECPRFLFPFARRIIADLTGEGGFPPFMLEPLDFAGIYASRRAAAQGQLPGQGNGQA